jgi:hypothetical protein
MLADMADYEQWYTGGDFGESGADNNIHRGGKSGAVVLILLCWYCCAVLELLCCAGIAMLCWYCCAVLELLCCAGTDLRPYVLFLHRTR